MFFTATVVVLLQQHISMARIAILGSVLLWLGLVASAFVPSIAWMCFTFGFIHGGGKGTTLVAINTILLPYFDKYRGVASGMRYAGETCSGLFFPKILVFLETAYGFKGMLLILGAILMHATALVLLLEEPRWLKRSQQTTKLVIRVLSLNINENKINISQFISAKSQSIMRDVLSLSCAANKLACG
ncbi:monocarboxylate transporter 11-like [Ixodes scapularis]|uniref:monocarboxylate transporter 11-like n=1 Tax=Ixodes scapularis TaxID=6945 RepID=UPI001A9F4B52|nr:monocarboxylate transporter 11-like [Ixodes scapularis]